MFRFGQICLLLPTFVLLTHIPATHEPPNKPSQSFWEVLSPQQQLAYVRFVNNNRTALFQLMVSDQLGSSDMYLTEAPVADFLPYGPGRHGGRAVSAESLMPVEHQPSTAAAADNLQAVGDRKAPDLPAQASTSPGPPQLRPPAALSTVRLWFQNADPVEVQLNRQPYKEDPVWLAWRDEGRPGSS